MPENPEILNLLREIDKKLDFLAEKLADGGNFMSGVRKCDALDCPRPASVFIQNEAYCSLHAERFRAVIGSPLAYR